MVKKQSKLVARGFEEDSSEILQELPKESLTLSHSYDHGVQQMDMQLHRYKISLLTRKRNR